MAIKSVYDGGDDGVTLCPTTADKCLIWGTTTPVAQQSAGTLIDTTTAVSTTPYGFSSNQAASLLAAVAAIQASLKALGFS
jgi:hypothetical protein